MSECKRTVRLFHWEFESIDDYSCSLPSATTMWKVWKNNKNAYNSRRLPNWYLGQYVPTDKKDYIGIRWFKIVLREGPKPRYWEKPDWANHKRFRAESKHGFLSPSWELNGCPEIGDKNASC